MRELEVFGHAHKDAFGFSSGTISRDGTFRFVEGDPACVEWLEPLAERPTTRMLGPPCRLGVYAASRRIELIDLLSGQVLNAAEADAPVLSVWRWSPDGRDVLYREYNLPPDIRAEMTAAHERGSCGEPGLRERASQAPFTWHILSADGSAPIEVASPREAYERWYGDRLITFVCGDEEVAGRLPTSDPCSRTTLR